MRPENASTLREGLMDEQRRRAEDDNDGRRQSASDGRDDRDDRDDRTSNPPRPIRDKEPSALTKREREQRWPIG
jgi:hypothetical protein